MVVMRFLLTTVVATIALFLVSSRSSAELSSECFSLGSHAMSAQSSKSQMRHNCRLLSLFGVQMTIDAACVSENGAG